MSLSILEVYTCVTTILNTPLLSNTSNAGTTRQTVEEVGPSRALGNHRTKAAN